VSNPSDKKISTKINSLLKLLIITNGTMLLLFQEKFNKFLKLKNNAKVNSNKENNNVKKLTPIFKNYFLNSHQILHNFFKRLSKNVFKSSNNVKAVPTIIVQIITCVHPNKNFNKLNNLFLEKLNNTLKKGRMRKR